MTDLAEELIGSRVEERLNRRPFCVDKARMTRLNGEFTEVVREFGIAANGDTDRLHKAHSYLLQKPQDLSLELSNAPKGQRRNLGFVSVGDGYLIVVLKTEKLSEKEELTSYGFDTYFLHMIRLTVLDVLRSYLPKRGGLTGLLQVTGWIDKVTSTHVKFCYYNESGHVVFAEVPKERFSQISDLRERTEFLIQTWEEAGKPMCDFLPLTASSETVVTSGIENMLRLAENAFRNSGANGFDEPPPPRDWSDRNEVDSYLEKLKDKYKGIDWAGGGKAKC
ncbi:MAG: hypothetical protein ACYTE3_22290 [Planctomycetota bacterium]|jgi:hypothetical protein